MPLKKEIRKALLKIPGVSQSLDLRNEWRHIQSRNRRFPELQWCKGSSCEEERVEATRVIDGRHVFAFGGYIDLGKVSQRVDRYDMRSDSWQQVSSLPEGMAQTHNGVACDGRCHAYLLSGQLGPHCSPATSRCWSFNTRSHSWSELPPLPEARYMPLAYLSQGRLHCMAGTLANRMGLAHQHWSIAVDDGMATEDHWRVEADLDWSRTHTATLPVDHELLVFAGQTGDVKAIEGDPEFLCDFSCNNDVYFDEVFAFDFETFKRRQLTPMSVKSSHSEYGVVRVGDWIIVSGGIPDRRIMSDWIHAYHLKRDEWKSLGRLPFFMKSKITAVWRDRLFVILGQKSKSETDLRPGPVSRQVWHAQLPEWITKS